MPEPQHLSSLTHSPRAASSPPTALAPLDEAHEMPMDLSACMQREGGTPLSTSLFVMLPLDCVNGDGVFTYQHSAWFCSALRFLASSGACGVAVDVWWGAVEREPGQYQWSGYRHLFDMIKQTGLKLQVVLSFHACGGNVGDTAHVPLPSWVVQCGDIDPDLWHTDRPQGGCPGRRNKEYLSVWADEAPGVLSGRSPMQCYEDFMVSFKSMFESDIGTLIEEIVVGAGPCGELRYPSYVEANGWKFPGIGEFQCYDRRALASLSQASHEAGHPEWGYGGPHDTGEYNSSPEETGFYNHEGSWDSSYGRFFLEWYSVSLLRHGERLMEAARRTFSPGTPSLSPKNQSASLMKTSAPSSEASADTHVLGPFSHHHLPCTPAMLVPLPVSRCQMHLKQGTQGTMGQIHQMSSGQVSEVDLCSNPSNMEEDVSIPLGETRSRHISGFIQEVMEEGDAVMDEALEAEARSRAEAEATALAKAGLFALPLGLSSSTERRNSNSLATSLHAAPIPASSALYTRQQTDIAAPLIPLLAESGVEDIEEGAEANAAPAPVPSSAPLLTLKIAGIHWWFKSRSHAAELTAGYYNTATRDGYAAIVDLCAKHRFGLTLTCIEMCDTQHPPSALCSPEGLLKQVRSLCALRNVPLAGENALPIFLSDGGVDSTALDRIIYNSRPWHGAAAMAAYWSSKNNSAAGAGERSSSEDSAAAHDGNTLPRSGLYRHTVHPSVNCSLSTYTQGSPVSSSGRQAGNGSNYHHAPGNGRGMFASSGNVSLLPATASDPAIAATGLRADSYADISDPLPSMRSFTFLRLGPEILQASTFHPWTKFVWRMREGGFC